MKALKDMTTAELLEEKFQQYLAMFRCYNDPSGNVTDGVRQREARACIPRDRNITMEFYRRYKEAGGKLKAGGRAPSFWHENILFLRRPMASAIREAEIESGGSRVWDMELNQPVWKPLDVGRTRV